MPQLINYMDQEAVERNKDLYFVGFDCGADEFGLRERVKDDDPRLLELMDWCNTVQIGTKFVGPRSDSGWIEGGPLYLALDVQPGDGKYELATEHLENPDGTMKREDVAFYILPLSIAQKTFAECMKRYEDEDYCP